MGRLHPRRMNRLRVGGYGNVFGDQAEARPGAGRAVLHGRFTWELMRQDVALRHAKSMFASGGSKSVIPLKHRQALRGTLAVESLKQSAFGADHFRLCIHRIRSKE